METSIRAILDEKGHAVHSVKPTESVLRAVEEMSERHLGAILVCEADRTLGILSERDVMTRVILRKKDPAATKIDEVMTRDVVVIEPTTTTNEAMAIMTEKRCRHLPVVEKGKIVGVISIGDLVRHVSKEQEFEIRMLTDYVSGTVR
jgi:CBS domain-containing protein